MNPKTYDLIRMTLGNKIKIISSLIECQREFLEDISDIDSEFIEKTRKELRKYLEKQKEYAEALKDFEDSIDWSASKEDEDE